MGKKKLLVVEFPIGIVDTIPTGKNGRSGLPIQRLQVDFLVIINGKSHLIKAGFEFDMASTPWGFRNTFYPADPQYTCCALIHDLNCDGELWSREIGDKIFLAGMVTRGVPKWKRTMMYIAVRVGSGSFAMKQKISKKARDVQKKYRKKARISQHFPLVPIPLWSKI